MEPFLHPFLLIALLVLLQTGLYWLIASYGDWRLRFVVPAVLVFSYLTLIPAWYTPAPDPAGPDCGMGVVALFLGFAIGGGGLTLVVHLAYEIMLLMRRLQQKKAAE